MEKDPQIEEILISYGRKSQPATEENLK